MGGAITSARRPSEELAPAIRAELPGDFIEAISDVQVELPGKARLFASVPCSICGEPVMEARLRTRDGQPSCIPCSDRYRRGWEING